MGTASDHPPGLRTRFCLDLAELRIILRYLLRALLPVAERWNVWLAMHPDDPPLSPTLSVGRTMRSVADFQRLDDLLPGLANGITLCQGNFQLMTDDNPAAIPSFGASKTFSLHFRDVPGSAKKFTKAWYDDAPTDLLDCLGTCQEVGIDGIL